jgi:hypothetical protein
MMASALSRCVGREFLGCLFPTAALQFCFSTFTRARCPDRTSGSHVPHRHPASPSLAGHCGDDGVGLRLHVSGGARSGRVEDGVVNGFGSGDHAATQDATEQPAALPVQRGFAIPRSPRSWRRGTEGAHDRAAALAHTGKRPRPNDFHAKVRNQSVPRSE